LAIFYLVSVAVELAVFVKCLRGIRLRLVLIICAAANLVTYTLFAIPYIQDYFRPNPRLIQRISVSNLETVRSALSQYAADQNDACYPLTEAIATSLEKLNNTLGNYGLDLPRNRRNMGWSKLDYVRDPQDCMLYTFTVEVAGGDAVLKASPERVCCDDKAPTGPNCELWWKNMHICSDLTPAPPGGNAPSGR
jgi:hypothetical protein